MEKPFVYGVAVSGDNFTDRKKETKRLKMNFESGVNTILISPRRMGKTSIVGKVMSSITDPKIKVVMMDIYDCRSESDFYERFAASIIKGVAGKVENMIAYGISPKDTDADEILNLPQRIASKRGVHIVVCIDEFQQIGEFPDSLTVQKRLRGVWQHQGNVSYCLFGSKKHLMEKIFQRKSMPFYQFGDMIFLDKISTGDWIDYICSRFESRSMTITRIQAERICMLVENYSSYVQQLSWNVMIEADKVVSDADIDAGFEELLHQTSSLFMEQIGSLTSYQMNFLKAVVDGVHSGFTSSDILARYSLGAKSNVARIQKALIERELVEKRGKLIFASDPVFSVWFKREYPR